MVSVDDSLTSDPHMLQSKDSKGTDVWVPVTIDINAHVFEPTGYTEPEIRAAPRFVEDYLSDLASAPPIDASRPLWECHILNGTSGIAKSHMVVRIHHSLGDGTSLMSLLLACTRRLGKPDELPSIPEAKRRKREMKGNSKLCWILSTVILFWNTLMGIFVFTSTGIWLKDSDSALKGHEGVEKMKKKIVYQIFDIDDMRVVKDAVNGVSWSHEFLGRFFHSPRFCPLYNMFHQGIWVLNGYFFLTCPLFLGYETRDEYMMVSKPQIEVVATFLISFGAHMNNVLFNIKVKILVLDIKWSYGFPPACWLVNLE